MEACEDAHTRALTHTHTLTHIHAHRTAPHARTHARTQALRIYKHYDLGGPGFGRLSFSSYPGETFSDGGSCALSSMGSMAQWAQMIQWHVHASYSSGPAPVWQTVWKAEMPVNCMPKGS
eukprot:209424-Pelagomonas_calceolata.AAC.3